MSGSTPFLTDKNVVILLSLGALIMAFRAVSVTLATVRSVSGSKQEEKAALTQGESEIQTILNQDSALASMRGGKIGRNPFGPPASTAPPRPAVTKDVVQPLVLPVVTLLVVDETNRTTQLEVDGELSRRLGEGETFRGWTITEISPSGVRVEKDGQSYTLR